MQPNVLVMLFHRLSVVVSPPFTALPCGFPAFRRLSTWFSLPFTTLPCGFHCSAPRSQGLFSCMCNRMCISSTAVSQARPHKSVNTQLVPHEGRSSVNPNHECPQPESPPAPTPSNVCGCPGFVLLRLLSPPELHYFLLQTVQDMFITPLYQQPASHTLASRAHRPQPHARSSSATGLITSVCAAPVHHSVHIIGWRGSLDGGGL